MFYGSRELKSQSSPGLRFSASLAVIKHNEDEL